MGRVRRWLVLTSAVVLTASCGGTPPSPAVEPVSGTDVTSYNQDAAQTRHAADVLTPPLTRQWHRSLDYARVALISDGRLFLPLYQDGFDSELVALGLTTGRTLWRRPLDSHQHYYAASKDSVFVLGLGGELTAYRTSDGGVRWTRQLATSTLYGFSNPPTYAAGSVYIAGGGRNGTLVALDATTGRTRWTQGYNGAGGTLSVHDGRVYGSFDGPQVYAFRASDGSVAWYCGAWPHGGGYSTIVATDRRLYVPEGTGMVMRPDGTLVDAFSATGPVAAGSGYLVTIERDGSLHAMGSGHLRHRWFKSVRDGGYAAPVISGRLAYASSSRGGVRAFDLASGDLVTEVPAPAYANVVIGGNRLVVVAEDGVSVYAD